MTELKPCYVKGEDHITPIDKSGLVAKATEKAQAGWRLVHICCTTLEEGFEITYSFGKGYEFDDYRVVVPKADGTLPSITGAFLAAFTYENEIHDLFGINVTDNALDFKGTFYRIAVKTPFATLPPKAAPKAKEPAQPKEQVQ